MKIKRLILTIFTALILTTVINVKPVQAAGGIEGFVDRLYKVCLGRTDAQIKADKNGFNYWVNGLRNGTISGSEAAQGFLLSKEMMQKNLSDIDYVEKCYNVLLNRKADTAGKKYWAKLLRNHHKSYVINGMVNSNEFRGICNSYGVRLGTASYDASLHDTNFTKPNANFTCDTELRKFVERLYTKALNRKKDDGGVQYWIGEIKKGYPYTVYSAAADGFFHSDEFINLFLSNDEYIKRLYRTFLGREPEPSGFNYWRKQIALGQTRDELLSGFANSDEFAGIVASFANATGCAVAPTPTPTPTPTPNDSSTTVKFEEGNTGIGMGPLKKAEDDMINFTINRVAKNKAEAYVKHFYSNFFSRTPSTEELQYWAKILENAEMTGSTFITKMFYREEFRNRNTSDGQFVDICFKTLLNRNPTSEEKYYFASQLLNNDRYSIVASNITNSTECQAFQHKYGITYGQPLYVYPHPIYTTKQQVSYTNTKYAFKNDTEIQNWVKRCYNVILGRNASASDVTSWTNQIKNGAETAKTIVIKMFHSKEYVTKYTSNAQYIRAVYKICVGREITDKNLSKNLDYMIWDDREYRMSRDKMLSRFIENIDTAGVFYK